MSETTNQGSRRTEIACALSKIAALPGILDAAQMLARHGLLQGESATAVVKRYVIANPEINEALSRAAVRNTTKGL